MDQDQTSQFGRFSKKIDVGVSIILISATFFLTGIGYNAGFLQNFGLAEDLFSKESHLIVLNGFYCLVQLLVPALFLAAPIAIFLMLRGTVIIESPRFALRVRRSIRKAEALLCLPIHRIKAKANKPSFANQALLATYAVGVLPVLLPILWLSGKKPATPPSSPTSHQRHEHDLKVAMDSYFSTPFSLVLAVLFCYGWGAFIGIQDGDALIESGNEVRVTLSTGKTMLAREIICTDVRCGFLQDGSKVVVLSNDQIVSIDPQVVLKSKTSFDHLTDVFSLTQSFGIFRVMDNLFAK